MQVERRENCAHLRKVKKGLMIVEAVELIWTRWVGFGYVQLGQRERREEIPARRNDSKGLRHNGVCKNMRSLAC